ncbi:MAG TPA: FG-GAP-like repeat-containing protein [Bryobacteraceae bacterium]|nr:FG-GAP-like repeat-containing protein [Bryobacteraceae bacterium]
MSPHGRHVWREEQITSKKILISILAVTPILLSVVFAATHDFVPDFLFTGSSLAGWQMLGHADSHAQDGEITVSPRDQDGGWLLLPKSYQDLEFYTEFRCNGACDVGVLFRAEKTSHGGLKGTYLSLKSGDLESYEVTLNPDGKIASRTPLEKAKVQFARMATGAWTNGQAHVPGFSSLASTLAEQEAEEAKPSAKPEAPRASRPAQGRSPFPRAQIAPNDWNTVGVIVDADMVWVTANGRRIFPADATTDRMMGYGPIALHVAGSGEVRFKEISVKDLNRQIEPAEKISPHFRMQRLSDFFYSWGATTGDINHDGVPDVIAGPFYFLGPDYTERHEFTSARTYSPATNFPQGMVYFAYDFTGDGWTDILVVDSRPIFLYVNPRGEDRRWDRYNVVSNATSEIELFRDIDGDGKPEVLFTGPGAVMEYAKPDPDHPTEPWKEHKISEPGLAGPHGMGIGDINGDGRMDVVNSRGWWEQPSTGASEGPWKFHPESFGTGGAEMGIYDVNGDGLNDVVTAIAAHGWGIAWFEQKRDSQGNISFVRHDIMGDFSTKNAGDVTFSEPHGLAFTDLDGDGIPDMVVGKRLYSHLESHLDPNPYGPAVLYWYRTVRNPKAPGGAEFVPELIHNRSGVGSQFVISDLNGDAAPDIITSCSKGTFIFWNQLHKAK